LRLGAHKGGAGCSLDTARLNEKNFVKHGKTYVVDTEPICKVLTNGTMRFFAAKTVEQQAVLMLHKSRDLMVGQRAMLITPYDGIWLNSVSERLRRRQQEFYAQSVASATGRAAY
jgi:hypothetical protein